MSMIHTVGYNRQGMVRLSEFKKRRHGGNNLTDERKRASSSNSASAGISALRLAKVAREPLALELEIARQHPDIV